MNKALLFIGLLLLVNSCLRPLEIGIGSINPALVVEGVVTDQPGMSFVRLGTISDIQGVGANLVGQGAQVTVIDDRGNEIAFQESFPGRYVPLGNFTGEVGRSYTLDIITRDGERYLSTTETMNPAIQIEQMSLEFEVVIDPVSGARRGFHLVDISIANDPTADDIYFRTSSRGIAHVFSAPLFECDRCSECWSFRVPINNNIVIGSNRGLADDFKIRAARIAYDFRDEYFVEISVFSLSKEGFDFWQSILNQLEITGTIFDPQITKARGNISNLNPEGHVVHGYFGASAISKRSLIFNRADTEFRVALPIPIGVCVEVWRDAVSEKPDEFN